VWRGSRPEAGCSRGGAAAAEAWRGSRPDAGCGRGGAAAAEVRRGSRPEAVCSRGGAAAAEVWRGSRPDAVCGRGGAAASEVWLLIPKNASNPSQIHSDRRSCNTSGCYRGAFNVIAFDFQSLSTR